MHETSDLEFVKQRYQPESNNHIRSMVANKQIVSSVVKVEMSGKCSLTGLNVKQGKGSIILTNPKKNIVKL